MSAYKTITSDNVTVGTTLTFPNRIATSNLPTGTANLVLVTNAGGLPVYSNIRADNISGGLNEQSLWNSAGVSTWRSRSFRYGIYSFRFNVQDWNSGATTALTYSGQSSASQTYGTTTFTNFTESVVGTSLLCNTTATYMVNMYCCLTNGGLGSAAVRFNILINGVVTGGGPCETIGLGETKAISGSFPITISAGAVVSFQATRLSGTSSLTVDGINSSFSITLVQTL